MKPKTNRALIKKLKEAASTCMDCGKKYGTYSVGCSSVRNGKCNVCGKETRVTETRDFGYFRRGIAELIAEDEQRKNLNKPNKGEA